VHNKGEVKFMGTERPRFSITVSEDMYSDINKYQHENRISTQTKAIAQILQIGLDALGDPRRTPTKKSPAPAEPETGEGTDSRTESFYRLLIREGYLIEGEDFTDAQVEILRGVLQILDAAFPRRKAPEGGNARKVG